MSDTPELDKMRSVHEDSQVIGEFLEWAEYNGYHFTKEFTCEVTDFWGNTTEESSYVPVTIEGALADYYEIDLAKVEQERRALLTAQAAHNEKHRDTYTVHPAPEEG